MVCSRDSDKMSDLFDSSEVSLSLAQLSGTGYQGAG